VEVERAGDRAAVAPRQHHHEAVPEALHQQLEEAPRQVAAAPGARVDRGTIEPVQRLGVLGAERVAA
jgi:hypothetical protein